MNYMFTFLFTLFVIYRKQLWQFINFVSETRIVDGTYARV